MVKSVFSVIGAFAIFAVVLGLVVDVMNFDRTSGGYEYPYEGWSGETIDFSAMYQTKEGLYKNGYVIDLFFNCNTGLVTWEVFGLLQGEFRQVSERAMVVHKPQDECKARGFNPSSWAKSELL